MKTHKPLTRESEEAAQRFAAILPADTYYAVIHEVDGNWRVWEYYKTLRGAEREAAKITTRPVKIVSPRQDQQSRNDYARGFVEGYKEAFEKGYQAGLRKAASHV